jgi:hypothetical protein
MLIALGCTLADVQHRLGHRKPDTTLRIYTHQWGYRDAQQSTIAQRLTPLLSSDEQQSTSTPELVSPRRASR